MKRLLPPLLLVLFLAFVAWRASHSPARAHAQAKIEEMAAVAGGDPASAAPLLDAIREYLDRYGREPANRWFAARILLRVGAVPGALDVVWNDPRTHRAPGTARRLGGLLLETAGFWDGENLEKPRPGADVTALVLADGGDVRARAYVDERIRTEPWMGLKILYYATTLYARIPLRDRVVASLRARNERETDIAAALLAAGPESYDERAADIALLREVVEGTWRREQRLIWSAAAVALGRSEDPQGRVVLGALLDRLKDSPQVPDREDAGMAAVGLLAGGDWNAFEAIRPFLEGPRPHHVIGPWTMRALVWRLHASDPKAVEAIRTWWARLPPTGRYPLRPRLAFEVFLRDDPQDAKGPLASLLDDLEAPGALPVERVLAAAVRFRAGRKDAADDLVEVLRAFSNQVNPAEDAGLMDPELMSPFVQAARALYLYDDSSGH